MRHYKKAYICKERQKHKDALLLDYWRRMKRRRVRS